MSRRWGPSGPPPEAYGRTSDLQRFRPLVAAADELLDELIAGYEVTVEEWTDEQPPSVVRGRRLTPRQGSPLAVGETAFPGIVATFGHWARLCLPACGCDACGEESEDCVQTLRSHVDALVGGLVVERLDATSARRELIIGERRRSRSLLTPERLAAALAVAPAGTYVWPSWPRRSSA